MSSRPVEVSAGASAVRLAAALPGMADDERLALAEATLPRASEAERRVLALDLIGIAARDAGGPGMVTRLVCGALGRARPTADGPARARRILGGAWSLLPADLRSMALTIGVERWRETIEHLAASAESEDRAAAAVLAAGSVHPALTPMAVGLLSDPDRSVQSAAEACVAALGLLPLRMGEASLLGPLAQLVDALPTAKDPAQPMAAANAALCEALDRYEAHRRRPVLSAALAMAASGRADAALLRRLTSREHPAHGAITMALRREPVPLLRAAALAWLVEPALSAASLDRLAAGDGANDHEALLRRAHLARRPLRSRRLAGLGPRVGARESGGEGSPAPTAAQVRRLTRAARRALPGMLAAMSAGEGAQRGVLEPLLADPDAGARLAALRAAGATERADFVFDPEIAVARHAALLWSSAGAASDPRRPAERARARVLARLERSPHAAVRRIAEEDLLRLDPLRAESAASRLAARRWLASDPAGLLEAVDARLASDAAEQRLAGVELVRVLRLERRFVVRLAELARRAGEPAVVMAAASAVRSLGRLSEPAAARAVEAALASPDARVCSNAIEAIACQRARADEPAGVVGRLVEFKDDAQHRVRATAVRALLGGGESAAGESLLEMLGDERAAHRLAGLWAADRVMMPPIGPERLGERWAAVAHRVAALAEQDEDGAVRGRAERTARRLLASIGGAGEEQIAMEAVGASS